LYTILQFNLPFDHYERYIERIQSFTPESLLDVQRRMFGADAMVIGAGGVRSVIEPAIAPFAGVIESWNSDGY
jgi:predicted Zn-dependent peptidase